MRLTSIHVYPVKSLGGSTPAEAVVEPWGLRGDRRWLALNPDGTYLTARTEPRMLGLTALPRPGGLTIHGLDGSTFDTDEPVDGVRAPTAVSRLESVRLASNDAHTWLSQQLGTDVRLGWLDDPHRRSVALDHGGQPGDPLNLADAGPLLLASVPSMNQLNDWIAETAVERGEEPPELLPISRFRPTIVVDGPVEPFAEDNWKTVTVGGVAFRFAEACDRCVLTTIDVRTFRTGKEPIRTLARFRQWDHKTHFGVRLVPMTTGVIRVGDAVSVA